MKPRSTVRLSVIDADTMLVAIQEFNDLGRDRFLKRYSFSRSSKFYLIHEERIYDTKVLVGAAYLHATGKRLASNRFTGGVRTKAVFQKIKQKDPRFAHCVVFEDKLGELANLAGEFDTLPRGQLDLRKLGFSKWLRLSHYMQLHTRWLPGVYVLATSPSQPIKMSLIDHRVVYIEEMVDQTLHKRLYQLCCSLDAKRGHSGGATLRKKGFSREKLWVSVRSFPLGYGIEAEIARSLRSSQIRSLERTLLHEYVRAHSRYPVGNSK